MQGDPGGLYSRLEVDPAASPEAIAAAFRRKARVLHPDVPGSGDAAAFIRLKEAYDVLGDSERRARYDRAARAAAADPAPRPAVAEPRIRPRLSDLPVPLWAALGGIFCVAAVMAVLQFSQPRPQAPHADVRPFAPSVPAQPRPAGPAPTLTPATTGPTDHYVVPGKGDAVLWRQDAGSSNFQPAGRLTAFTPVQAVRLVARHGLVEVRLTDGGSAFIDADRLTTGDGATARRGYCAYNAGKAPANGEVLARRGNGPAQVEIQNRATQPAVVKLRDASGAAAATVFVTPGDRALVTDLPDTAYRPDFALGELWSRACNDFAAGTRAQRFPAFALPVGLSPLTIPPDLSAAAAPVDIPDAVFERD